MNKCNIVVSIVICTLINMSLFAAKLNNKDANMKQVAINGFGRIGRNFLRAILQDSAAHKKLNVAVINIGPAQLHFVAHMFKYDTLMGTYPGSVQLINDELVIDGHYIKIIQELDPLCANWSNYSIDWVVECTGCFTDREGAQKHLESGAGYVLISAPAKNEDITIIPGVNYDAYDKNNHKIVSLGSCTTNAFVTMLQLLHDAFTLKQAFMTTVHAYTNNQVLLDVETKDLRRSRAAALNIIPTTTGATQLVKKIIPSLQGSIFAMALRVPVGKVSLIDLTFIAEKSLSVEAINNVFKIAQKTTMKSIVGITQEPLVSSDFSGNNNSVTIDGLLTNADCNVGKVFGWYDNEWGYSVRLKDFLMYVS